MPLVVTKYYVYPFAIAGTVTAVPDATQVSGAVSYQQGYGPFYTLLLGTDPAALAFPEPQHNQLLLDATTNLQQYQQWGTPNFVTSSQNLSVNLPYDKWAYALYNDGTHGLQIYQSLVTNNATLPTNVATWRVDDNNAASINYNAITFDGAVVNGNMVYFDSISSTFKQAVANGTIAQNAIGFADLTYGRIIATGEMTLLSGLTPGHVYYLSTTTPGAITTTVPTQNIIQVGTAYTSTIFLTSIVSTTQVIPNICASMYASAAQTFSAGGGVVIVNFNVVEFDTYSLCNTGAHSITVNQTGKWFFSGYISGLADSPSDENSLTFFLYKNGTVIKQLGSSALVGTSTCVISANGSVTLQATAGDVFTTETQVLGTGGGITCFPLPPTDSYFQAEFLGT